MISNNSSFPPSLPTVAVFKHSSGAMLNSPASSACNASLVVGQLLRSASDTTGVAWAHAKLIKSGASNTPTRNHLINAYVRCRAILDAHNSFDEMPDPNVVSWTSLMSGYVAAGLPNQALRLFTNMCGHVSPNSFTFATAINACSRLANLRTGRELHAHVEALGFRSDLVVSTSLVDMYAKSNNVVEARSMFDRMDSWNVVSWGSMISAYAQNACGAEALTLFTDFLRENPSRPNHFMFSSVVSACSGMGRLGFGRTAHAAAIRHGHDANEFIAGALIDMYAKCGCVDYSVKVFRLIDRPSLVPYTAMIMAAAKFGLAKLSLNLFDEMLDRSIAPNSVTLLGVLHACSHSGLVDTGLRHLNSMHREHGIVPSVKHYTCAVDMLGRAGRLDEAYELSREVRAVGDDALMLWSALLSASRTHGRLDLAADAGKRLATFDQDVAGAYVAMSNAYMSAGQSASAGRVRSEMRRRRIRKEPGCSWVEVKDVAHVFYAGDASACVRGGEVMELLRELEVRMAERGYLSGGGSGSMLDELEGEEEGRGLMVGVHSERLALAFGLLSIPGGATIRVMKNLRMCRDCHVAFKLISDIVGRDIVVRDLNRFHRFKDGSCSCGDYW